MNAHIVLLVSRSLVEGTKNFVKKTEGTLSPDDEATKVATWRELENIEPAHVHKLHTRDVAERLDNAVILVVNNEGTTTLPMTTVPQLSLASTKLARVGNLHDIGVGIKGFEKGDSLFCLLEGLGGGSDDKRDLLNLLDTVSTSEDKSGESRSSKRGDGGKATLVLVNLYVPLAPSLGRREHTTTTAHVSKGSLAGSVCSSTTNTRDTSDSTAGTPRFGTGLMASLLADGVCLPLVFRKALCNNRWYCDHRTYVIIDTHCEPATLHRDGWEQSELRGGGESRRPL